MDILKASSSPLYTRLHSATRAGIFGDLLRRAIERESKGPVPGIGLMLRSAVLAPKRQFPWLAPPLIIPG